MRDIKELREEILTSLKNASSSEYEALKIKYLGRKGVITSILRGLKEVPKEERKVIGMEANKLKKEIEEFFRQHKVKGAKSYSGKFTDYTLPGRRILPGAVHPVSRALDEIIDIFVRLGFSIEYGPEIESDYYNFEALNVPKHHPSRDMQDTFYIAGSDRLLRTHTSPVQIRTMENQKPPIRMIAPGRCYRKDEIDPSHSPVFHQVEGLYVDENVTFADLKGILSAFAREFFGPDTKTRFTPSFFPFTEPSSEMYVSCVFCGGKGCSVCQHTGWLEVLGCGLVNPKVFQYVGYNTEKYSGFAFGLGVERFAMLKYGIDDMRLLFENNIEFLKGVIE
ncbi:phenylalanine--tRNA ligase subunit alpha [candidate division WOR-3 bacterium]|nr:phenylalanine--tRNA ligase subunit alpha [candidate division WOR-3 bacterium]